MEFDAVLLAPRRAAMNQKGLWHNRTINQDLDDCLTQCPDKLALSAVRVDSGEQRRFSYREMATMADRIAVGLARRCCRAVAQLVAVHPHLSGLLAAGRGHESADAYFSRTRTGLHAQARRRKSGDCAAGVPWLRS